MKIEVFESRL